jgi:hypothetical protein
VTQHTDTHASGRKQDTQRQQRPQPGLFLPWEAASVGYASSRSRVGFLVEALKQLAQAVTASSARGAAVGTRMAPPCCCARTASERESLSRPASAQRTSLYCSFCCCCSQTASERESLSRPASAQRTSLYCSFCCCCSQTASERLSESPRRRNHNYFTILISFAHAATRAPPEALVMAWSALAREPRLCDVPS